MALYDINGKQIAVGNGSVGGVGGTVGIADLSEEIVNPVLAVNENTPVFNLLDISKVSVGRYAGNSFNQYYTDYRTSDYIPVKAGQTYVAQYWDSKGNDGYDCVMLFDDNKTVLHKCVTSGNGTIRYCLFTPEVNGFARYCYKYSETANPMVYIGVATTDTFVAYTGQTLTGDVFYQVASEFKGMIRRDVEPSNLYGKRVYIIGDSNSDNWANGSAKVLEKRYGCKVIGLGKYGARWETANGETDTGNSNAIGQWNAFVNTVGIDLETYTFPDDVVLLFMMGTNCGAKGTMTDSVKDLGEDVSTAIGAQKYILRRAKYYGRNIPIGIFLPWKGQTNEELAKIAAYYKIPTFDIPAIIADDEVSKGLVRPDGTVVSQNYITDGGNHLSAWGSKAFERIAHPWIAYQI
jgi:hypothetical protein